MNDDKQAPSLDCARLVTSTETYLTADEWQNAASAGLAPASLAPLPGRILARRAGSGAPHTRWHHLTPQQALSDAWPAAVGPRYGEACERVVAHSLRVRYIMAENAPERAPCTEAAWSVTLGCIVVLLALVVVCA